MMDQSKKNHYCHKETPGFFHCTGSKSSQNLIHRHFQKDVLRGFEMSFSGGGNVLVNVSQNHRYYSGDFNSSSRIREQEEALFPALAGARLFFSRSLSHSIPCCLRSPDKTHDYLGRSYPSVPGWDSNCLMEWLISCFTFIFIFLHDVAMGHLPLKL